METVVGTRPKYGWPFSLVLIVVPFPVVYRWWNGERSIDLAQALIVHGTSFVSNFSDLARDVALRFAEHGLEIDSMKAEEPFGA